MKKYIVFDIGGTEIKYSLMNEYSEILTNDVFKNENLNGSELLKKIKNIIIKNKEEHNVVGAAFSIPGFVNSKTGLIEDGGAIPDFNGVNIKDIIEKDCQIETWAENDANCVALAEKWTGNAKDSKDFLCLTIGTGIGGSIFINNELYRGSNYMAGEFGYMLINGFDEDKYYKDQILSRIMGLKGFLHDVSLEVGESVTGQDVFDKKIFGKEEILEAHIERFYKNFAIAIFNLIYVFNPEKILIGGAISRRDDIIDKLKENISKIEERANTKVTIEQCKHYNDSGKIGALYHFLNR